MMNTFWQIVGKIDLLLQCRSKCRLDLNKKLQKLSTFYLLLPVAQIFLESIKSLYLSPEANPVNKICFKDDLLNTIIYLFAFLSQLCKKLDIISSILVKLICHM